MNDAVSEKVLAVLPQTHNPPVPNMDQMAMHNKVKRIALTQQALQPMRNTSLKLPEEKKTQLLSEFSYKPKAIKPDKDSEYQTCHDRL